MILASDFSGMAGAGFITLGIVAVLSTAFAIATTVPLVVMFRSKKLWWLLPLLFVFWATAIVATRFQVLFPMLRWFNS